MFSTLFQGTISKCKGGGLIIPLEQYRRCITTLDLRFLPADGTTGAVRPVSLPPPPPPGTTPSLPPPRTTPSLPPPPVCGGGGGGAPTTSSPPPLTAPSTTPSRSSPVYNNSC